MNDIHEWAILFTYMSNYKGGKDEFLQVRGNNQFPYFIYNKDETYEFPIYWTCDPNLIMGHDLDKVSVSERKTFELLEQLQTI